MIGPRLMVFSALGAALLVAAGSYAQSRPGAPESRGLQHVTAPCPANQPAEDQPSGKAAMPKLKIEVFEKGTPSATISIPGWLLMGATKLMPKVGGKELQDKIDIDRLIELLKDPRATGVVIDIEDHKGSERVVISIARDDATVLQK